MIQVYSDNEEWAIIEIDKCDQIGVPILPSLKPDMINGKGGRKRQFLKFDLVI